MLKIDLQLFGKDWYTCNNCGYTFSDYCCLDFVGCDCGKKWCCPECAEADDWQADEKDNRTCKYCRKDDFEDSTLLYFLLDRTNMSRRELIDGYKKYKEYASKL